MNNHWALVIKLGFRVYYLTLYSYIYIYIHAYIYIYTYVHIYNMVLYGGQQSVNNAHSQDPSPRGLRIFGFGGA